MRGPNVETNRFLKLTLDRIVADKPESVIEFGFQFGEGFATGLACFPLDTHESQ
ncbi:MAG: hypothetical protein H0X01_00370, partial [Nitrospira sp.]|nr:hypothetical protein [Nitrospira sp.]